MRQGSAQTNSRSERVGAGGAAHGARQTPKRVYRIAILDDAVESARAPNWRIFRARLAELGLVEGRNVVYEARYARAVPERLPALAAELAALKPDIFAAAATRPSLAVKAAAPDIPLVFIGIADAIGPGLVKSLARREETLRGLSALAPKPPASSSSCCASSSRT